MKQALRPGGELELLTPDELRAELEGLSRRLLERPAVVRAEEDGATDGAGAGAVTVYRAPMGMGFRVSRVLVEADGFTPAVPFNGAGGFAVVERNGTTVDFLSLVAGSGGGIPALFEYPATVGPWFGNGDELAVRLVAGPLSTRFVARVEGLLEPIVIGN